MKTYKVELENDNFEIIFADNDKDAVSDALNTFDTVYNVILIDDNYNEVRTVF